MNKSLTISKGSQNQHMIDNRGPRNESEIGFPDYWFNVAETRN